VSPPVGEEEALTVICHAIYERITVAGPETGVRLTQPYGLALTLPCSPWRARQSWRALAAYGCRLGTRVDRSRDAAA
jgi:hypothetical protein